MRKTEAHPLELFERGSKDAAEKLRDELQARLHEADADYRYAVVVVPVHNDGPWYVDGYAVLLNDRHPGHPHLRAALHLMLQSQLGGR